MKAGLIYFAFIFLFFLGCAEEKKDETFAAIFSGSSNISGKLEYLDSPFVTAGDRLYMVGHQNGSFPELGWHIKGEMGGIWNHPIKLMDGFEVDLVWGNESIPLDAAETFTNYPFGNMHFYNLEHKNLEIGRWQFVPDGKEGITIQYRLQNTSDKHRNFDLQFTGHSDLSPTWLGERSEMTNGQDNAEYLIDKDVVLFKDSESPWSVVYGADRKSSSYKVIENNYRGKGISNFLNYPISLDPQSSQTITFTIAGSYKSEEASLKTFDDLQTNALTYLSQKKERYSKLASQSKLTIPDKELEQAFEWLKYNCDWLIRDVPEVGRGISAGIPDYPWWFGVDSEYALKGYMAVGQTDIVYKTIALIDSVSNAENGNGKIIHEMSTNGVVFNKGNINETPQFASLIWEVYEWNGDKEFLKKYFPTIKKGLKWLMQENDANNNLFPDGFGMMEIHGLDSEMIDVAVYTQRAFADASKIAGALSENELQLEYEEIAYTLKRKINNEFWSEEFNSFADFIGTDKQALHLIEDAIIRADTLKKPWAVKELQQTKSEILKNPSKVLRPFVLHHNWVVNTPMEMKIADSAKALKGLKTAKKFVNPFGAFVTGIDRDDSAGSDEGSFKGSKVFSYTGAVMTLPTGVLAVAENNYGRPDQALNYLQRMTRTFSYALPGSMYEVSPDYGMMAQAWNIYSYAIPIVNQFFGILPDAVHKKITIKPQMPSDWEIASLENVSVSNNTISIFYEKSTNGINFTVEQVNPDWTLDLVLPKMEGVSYEGTDNLKQRTEGKFIIFTSQEKEIKISLK